MILSLGSINADFQVRVRRPPGGSGTRLAHDLLRTSGGKGANVAVLAHRLGGDARLLGSVGDDDLAEQALAGPRREGIDVDAVHRVAGRTGVSSIAVAPDGEKSIVLALEANDAWAEHHDSVRRVVATAPAGSVLVVDLEVSLPCVEAAVQAARSVRFPVVLDPAPPERLPDGLMEHIDHVVPDHAEAAALTGIDTISTDGALRAAHELRRRGAGTAYVKLASGGCAVAGPDGATLVEAPDGVEVVDTTGAGDAFAGALAWALVEGLTATDAAVVAVAASACAVGRYGSQESYPTRSQLEAMRTRVTTASA